MKRVLAALMIGLAVYFVAMPRVVRAATVTWDGGGTDTNWNTCENWSGDACPGVGDLAQFNGTSTKNATINVPITVSGISIASGYTGTITQASGVTITMGAGGFSQADGVFIGGDSTVTLTSNFSLSGGAFTSTSGTWQMMGTFTHTAGGTFAHHSGTWMVYDCSGGTWDVNSMETLYNFTVNMNCSSVSIAASDTFIIEGALLLADGYVGGLTGTLEARGDVTVGSGWDGNEVTLKFGGSGTQTFTTNNSTTLDGPVTFAHSGTVNMVGSLTMNANKAATFSSGTFNSNGYAWTMTNNTLTQSGGTTNWGASTVLLTNLTLSGGTFNATSGTMSLTTDFTHTGGGTFVHSNGTVRVYDCVGSTWNVNSSETLYNLTVDLDCASMVVSASDTLVTEGTLTLTNGFTSGLTGTFDAKGDVVIGAGWDGTEVKLQFSGTGTQQWTVASNNWNSDVTIDKASGSVVLQTAAVLDANNQDLTVTTGTLSLNGNSLTVSGGGGTFTIGSAGTFEWNGNETTTAPTLSVGSTVMYDGSVGPYTVTDWAYQNLTINGGASTVFALGALESVAGNFTITSGIFALSGYALTVTGTFENTGTLRLIGTESVTLTNDTNSGTVAYVGDGDSAADAYSLLNWTYYNLTVSFTDSADSATASVSPLDTNGAFTLSSGTFTAPAVMTVGGNFARSGGTFAPNGGTVTFDDAAQTSVVSGSTTFYNVSCTTANKAITFTAASTQTVNGLLTLTGTSGNLLVLRSSSNNSAWFLNVAGTSSVDYVSVRDSDASGGNAITHAVAASRSVNVANNVNWSFNVAPTVASVTATQGADGGVTIAFQVDDADNDDTLRALVEYTIGSGWVKATMSEVDATTTATFGDPKVTTANPYQIGNGGGYITTSSGANTVTTTWNASLDETGIDIANAQVRVTPYDGTAEGSPLASSVFSLDLLAPTAVSATYIDANGNGTVDRVDVAFNETVSVTYSAGDWSFPVSGTVGLSDTGASAATNTIRLAVSATANITGGATSPTLSYTNTANRLTDAFGNAVATFGGPMTVSDGASPVVVSVSPTSGATGVARNAPVLVTFSEAMDTAFAEGVEFSMTPDATNWTAGWSNGDTVVTLTPTRSFTCFATYSLTLTAAAITSSGAQTLLTTGPEDGLWSFQSQSCAESSGSSTSDTVPPVILFVGPTNGDVLVSGQTERIRWAWTGNIAFVSVAYSLNDGKTWETIEKYAPNYGYIDWIVPASLTTQGRIRVDGNDLAATIATDQSDGTFSITAQNGGVPNETQGETGAAPLPDGVFVHDLLKLPDDGDPTTLWDTSVYYIGTDGNRHAFLNESIYLSWFTDFSTVREVPLPTLASVPLGNNVPYRPGVQLVKFQTVPMVYAIDHSGALRWITSEALARQLYGVPWAQMVRDLSDASYGNYSIGEPIWSAESFDPAAEAERVHYPSDAMGGV